MLFLWIEIKSCSDHTIYFRDIPLERRTFPGGTDSRFIRQKGVPALGFSPMRRTTPGLHEHDESLQISVFLEGITSYETIIPALANV